ncbi:MAG: hypothetical protein ABWZ77_05340 [Naasia sp.]
MTTAAGILLIVIAVWNFVVWPAFLRRVIRDPRSQSQNGKVSKFLVVHVVLVTISLVLALTGAVFGILLLGGVR